MRELLAQKIISPAELDSAVANHQQALAAADNISASMAKKTIRAPFSGRLGIRQVNLGQILAAARRSFRCRPSTRSSSISCCHSGSSASWSRDDVRVTTDALRGEDTEGDHADQPGNR